MVDTIIVGFAKYASYCGLIFIDKRHTTKFTKIYTPQKFIHLWYHVRMILLNLVYYKCYGLTTPGSNMQTNVHVE